MNENLRKALVDVGISELSDFQLEAFKKIKLGKDVLVVAPTGSGKTEAAVIPIFDTILQERRGKGIFALYITPLRALNRDMLRRLRKLAEILGITIDVRHGDTPESERVRQSKTPPEVLITTPETFQILFLGKKLRSALKNVRYVVIDEIHELADSERGVQLSVGLERLRELTVFQIVALSATVSSPKRVAAFVGREVEVVESGAEKIYQFTVIKPGIEDVDEEVAENLFIGKEIAAELRFMKELIDSHRSALIFVNTRQAAEAIGIKLKKICNVEVHHGSLSREARVEAEERFASGELKGLICTSSMELGIDIGHVDVVIQYNSPRQVVRLIQRVGRSGHRIGEVSKGYIVASSFDEILESWAIVKRALGNQIEDTEMHFKSLDVLANQISALALEYGRIDAEKAYRIIRRSYPFRNLSFEEFDSVCRFLSEIGRIFYDGEIAARRRTRTYFYDNISMIPDERRYKVVDVTTGRAIGMLDESFLSTFSGEVFAMKGELWRVLSVDDVVRVEPVAAEGEIPSWAGEEIPVPFEVAQDVGRIRMWIGSLLRNDPEKAVETLMEEFDTNEEACREVLRVIRDQMDKGFAIPTHNHLTIESADGVTVINACFGHKVNETIGRILALLLSARKGSNVSIEIDPYRIKLSPVNAEEIVTILIQIEPESVEFLAERALIETKLMQWKVVNAARKFGLIDKNEDLSRINLKNLVIRLRDTPIYREALREIFLEKMDIEKTREIFEKIGGEITYSVYSDLSPISVASRERSFDLIASKPTAAILKAFRKRIESERCRVYCLNCGANYSEVVSAVNRFHCIKCGSSMVAIFSDRRSIEDFRKEELFRIANLVMSYGKRAVYALNAYGVGVETAARLLSRYYLSDEDFFKALLEAEKNYVRTRKFWD